MEPSQHELLPFRLQLFYITFLISAMAERQHSAPSVNLCVLRHELSALRVWSDSSTSLSCPWIKSDMRLSLRSTLQRFCLGKQPGSRTRIPASIYSLYGWMNHVDLWPCKQNMSCYKQPFIYFCKVKQHTHYSEQRSGLHTVLFSMKLFMPSW